MWGGGIETIKTNKMNYQKLFEYMKDEHGVTLLESDMQEIQNIVLECESEQCNIANVGRSVSVYIEDRDIATIEALHDLLLDAHGYSLDFITLKRARELTAKMYKAFD